MRNGGIYRNDELLLARAGYAANTFERMRGLLFRPALEPDEALLIAPCNAIHTAGMRYTLDVAFLDRHDRIRKLVTGLKPWRAAGCISAGKTLELAAGTAVRLNLKEGQQLLWQEY
jgi:hypothetical protein